jgi:hypothetical protein
MAFLRINATSFVPQVKLPPPHVSTWRWALGVLAPVLLLLWPQPPGVLPHLRLQLGAYSFSFSVYAKWVASSMAVPSIRCHSASSTLEIPPIGCPQSSCQCPDPDGHNGSSLGHFGGSCLAFGGSYPHYGGSGMPSSFGSYAGCLFSRHGGHYGGPSYHLWDVPPFGSSIMESQLLLSLFCILRHW